MFPSHYFLEKYNNLPGKSGILRDFFLTYAKGYPSTVILFHANAWFSIYKIHRLKVISLNTEMRFVLKS